MFNSTDYHNYCKPKLTELLSCLKLDYEFTSAKGNFLYTKDGKEIVDFIGGFGAVLLGHNNEFLQEKIRTLLKKNLPVHAQVSIRSEASKLAKRLSTLTPGDKQYYVNFSNSGTESIEAALKHAYKVYFDDVRREYERITKILSDFYYKMENEGEHYELPANKTLVDFRDDLDEYNLTQLESFQNNPIVIAMKIAKKRR